MPVYERKSYTVSVSEEYTGRVVFVDVAHPTSAYVNQEVRWYARAKVVGGKVDTPIMDYGYVDGPTDKITIVKADGSKVDVSKGAYILVGLRMGDCPEGTEFDSREFIRGVIFPVAGTYKIELRTRASKGAPAAAGMAVPITVGEGAQIQIPWEYIAAFGAGIVVGAIAVSAMK